MEQGRSGGGFQAWFDPEASDVVGALGWLLCRFFAFALLTVSAGTTQGSNNSESQICPQPAPSEEAR